MAADDVDFTNLDQLAADLAAADPELIRSVSVDPSEVQVPGGWLRVDGVGPHTLGAVTLRATLHLIVPEGDVRRRLTMLAAAYNAAKPVLDDLGADVGDADSVGVILPGSSTPLPALAIPVAILTSPDPTP
jgi:hypothetical protein